MAEVTVTKAQDGQTVEVRGGDAISLELPENPSTGYTWAFTAIDETALEVGRQSYQGTGVGSGGMKTWRLTARAPARTRVELKRWRHWEGDRSIVERFAVTFDIKSG
jgi:inhibitor of cysteine peptidase